MEAVRAEQALNTPSSSFGLLPPVIRATSDLETVVTDKALSFAGRLNQVLKEINFDKLNSLLRSDYAHSPLPRYSAAQIEKDLVKLNPAHLTTGEDAMLRCLLLGQVVPLSGLQQGFGSTGIEVVNGGIDAGIFVEEPGGKIRTNNLLLCSHKLMNESAVFVLADIPPYMPTASVNRQRVYLGTDSYYLNAKLQTLSDVEGCVLEYGSGSGIQMITVLAMNPGVRQAVGLEIDARARNLSRFNAALNNVSDRFTVVEDQSKLSDLLGSSQIRLAFSNPPFIAAPYKVDVPNSSTPLDLSEVFCRAGWGGEDGLFHTRRFLEIVASRLDSESGQVVIYSQFVGDNERPTGIVKCAEEFNFIGVNFEKFPKKGFRMNHDLSTSDWARYLSATLKCDHPFITPEAISAVEQATLEMFNRTGIDKIHSGIITLSMPNAPMSNPDQLNRAEDKLRLFSAGSEGRCLLLGILGMLSESDRACAPDFGGAVYARPKILQELKEPQGGLLFSRPLNGGERLEVVSTESRYYYRVADKDNKSLEVGDAIEDGKLTDRYAELLRCVSITESHKILRDFKFGDCRYVDSSVINDAFGTFFSGKLFVELIPITNSFRISSRIDSLRSAKYGSLMNDVDGNVVLRGTMAAPGYLKLIQAIQAESPGWGVLRA